MTLSSIVEINDFGKTSEVIIRQKQAASNAVNYELEPSHVTDSRDDEADKNDDACGGYHNTMRNESHDKCRDSATGDISPNSKPIEITKQPRCQECDKSDSGRRPSSKLRRKCSMAGCSICTAVVPRYLCASHAADMFPAYVRNGPWCRCNRHLPPHNTTGVRIRGL